AYGHGSSVTYVLQYQYSSNGGSSWSAWAAAAGNLSGTSYTHSGRTAGYHYRYRVLAKNQAGTSNPSAASNTLLVIGTSSEPRNFRVGTGPSSYQLQMGWSSPADNGGSAVTGYVIQRRTSTNGSTW